MRKYLLLFSLLILLGNSLFSQFTVTVTYTGTAASASLSAGSPYASLSAAITALNAATITGAGNAVLNCSGASETAPAGGYSITFNGSATVGAIIDGNFGTALGSTGHTAGSFSDAVFKLVGAKYVTIQEFRMQENPANTTTAAATNNMTEFGVAFFYASTTSGAQNNTIQNNSITLNRSYPNTFGIYSNTQTNSTQMGTANNITAVGGICSNNKIYADTISSVNYGICMIGMPWSSGAVLYDNANDIGGSSYATGNIVRNQGTGAVTGTYLGLTSAICGITVSHCTGANIAYNRVAGSAAINIYGIYLRMTSNSISNTFTSNILNNQVTDTCTSSTTSFNLIGILNDIGGTGHTLNINNNKVFNCVASSASFQGGVIGIWTSVALPTINMNVDTVTAFSISGSNLASTASTRSCAFKVTNTPTNVTIGNSVVTDIALNNTGTGDFTVFDANGNYSGALTISNNFVDNITMAGTGSIFGYWNSGSPSGSLNLNTTTFQRIAINGVGTNSQIRFVNSTTTGNNAISISGNSIRALRVNTAIQSLGITVVYMSASNSQNVFNNSFRNILSGASNSGVYSFSGGSTACNVYGNSIDSFYSTGLTSSPTHVGIEISASGNIYNNKITNFNTGAAANPFIYAIRAFGGVTTSVYNNFVADLNTPSGGSSTSMAIHGIRVSPTNAIVYNNTVYLAATSTAVDFGSTCLSFGASTTIDCRNNIFINNSTARGLQYSAAILNLSSAFPAGTVPANFSTTSNNNCLFAAGLNAVIYKDIESATAIQQNRIFASCFDLSTYKAYMTGGRETASFSEIPPFLSITPGAMDLHLSNSIASGCINTGQTVSPTVTTDIDGTPRPVGTAYEIGADEVAGVEGEKVPPSISYTNISDIGCLSSTSLVATITDANGIASGANAPRLYYKKTVSFDNNNNIATANNNLVNGWKYVVATGSGPYTFTIDYSLLPGGFNPGDSISYFVAAQDPSGNVATTNATVNPCPSTVQFTSAQTAVAPPAINFFVYKNVLSGAYTIPGSYPTLTGNGGLFQAINNGYVGGNITVTVTANVVETGANALNQWAEYDNVGCAVILTPSYTLTVQSDGTARTFSATGLASTVPMINLNGADRVQFNGGTGSQRLLRFNNTNTSPAFCTPVFQLGNGATSITINNCDISSNGTSGSSPVSAGVLITSAGTNNNISINQNDIHDATIGTTGPLRHGVYAENNANTVVSVTNNNFYNITANPILLGITSIGNGQVVTGNSIYYSNLSLNLNSTFVGIQVLNTSTPTATGHTINNNFIGGQSPNGGTAGLLWNSSSHSSFKGIVTTTGAGTPTNISGNVVRNIYLSILSSVAFTGIEFIGTVSCTGNTIGDATNANLGVIIGGTTNSGNSNNYCIIGSSSLLAASATISNNTIANITHVTTSTSISRLHAINISYPSTSASFTVEGNSINNVFSSMRGDGNLFTTGNANSRSAVVGIISTTSASPMVLQINDNTISNLRNTSVANSTNYPGVCGIAIDGSTFDTLRRNKIIALSNTASATGANPASIVGIRLGTGAGGSNDIQNNFISLINGSNTNMCRIIGIFDNSTHSPSFARFYHNTVHIGGTQSVGTAITGAPVSAVYASNVSSGNHTLRNNIFHNTRTGGTGGAGLKHYAIALTSTAFALSSDYNNLTAPDVNALCLSSSTDRTLAAWRALLTPPTPDVNSSNVTPIFVDIANGDLHLSGIGNCALWGTGINNLSPRLTVTNEYRDIDNQTRQNGNPSTKNGPIMGADEFTVTAPEWFGGTSGVETDWATAANWCGNAVPTATSNVTIPVVTHYPNIISGVNAAVNNLTIANSASVTTTGTGTLSIAGTYSSNGTLINRGTLILNGSSAQSFPGSTGTIAAMNNLTLNNSSGANPAITLNANLSIRNELRAITGITNISNAIVTIRSTADSTARIAEGAGTFTYTGSGNFSVERYFSGRRVWRMLTAPVLVGASNNVFEAWQMGGNNTISGSGTFVTGPSPNSAVNGLDNSPLNNASLKVFNTATSGFSNVTNTKTTRISDLSSGTIAFGDTTGFFMFIRGDRTAANINAFNPSGSVLPTTLRDTGAVRTGSVTFNCNPTLTTHRYTLVGNPYASPVDFNLVTKNNVLDRFMAWDPNLNTVGGYVTVDGPGPGYTVVPYAPSTGTIQQTRFIQSSQAIIVESSGASPSITFSEAAKSNSNNLLLFRPLGNTAAVPTLAANIFLTDGVNADQLADGVVVQTGDDMNSGFDQKDAQKFANVNETIGIVSNQTVLSLERRKPFADGDTIFFTLSRTARRSYKFNVYVENFASNGLMAFLEDSYLNSSTPLQLDGHNWIDFSINDDAASAAARRFRIVFQKPTPVPVSFAKIRAWQQQQQVAVQWQVENQINIGQYVIEKSADGRSFSFAGTVAVQNSNGGFTYNWLDAAPFAGNNFYRIKTTDAAGQTQYSAVAKVWMGKGPQAMVLYPNPVNGEQTGLQMSNMPAGQYSIRIFNAEGQLLQQQLLQHSGGSALQTIQFRSKMASGQYSVEVLQGKEKVAVLPMLVQN